MSQSVRQQNLFRAEDFTKLYQSFKNINFQAYDFDTIRSALIDYIRDFYPEDFNDYIESSEFIAVIELLAYLGTTLSFRTDLNSRENFLDTAQRRESIVRLARMLSYQPRRNIASQGLMKITGIKTTEKVLDSLGRNLANTTIIWNDPNNDYAYEQFITVLNAALSDSNKFGRPYKKGTVGNVLTHLYKISSIPFTTGFVYNTSAISNGQSYPIDFINPNFTDGETFWENHPNPETPMHLIYRNDGNGAASTDTGFFMYFKQGTLAFDDFNYTEPRQNRTQTIDKPNINNQDVYVQKISDTGRVIEEWTRVPSVVGSNIAYNNIDAGTRTIFSTISELDDAVTIKYSDGNFGEVPKDLFRVWTRSSANEKVVFRPEEVSPKTINIVYQGADGREYTLSLQVTLEVTVANGAPSESNESIAQNAPQVFYTQDRMVNNEDYNVFPLTRGNEIAKVRTINRTHAGHSRYIDINDPTGTYSDLLIFAEDGAIYKEWDNSRAVFERTTESTNETIINFIQEQLNDYTLSQLFYDEYMDLVGRITPSSDISWQAPSLSSGLVSGAVGKLIAPGTLSGFEVYVKDGAKLKLANPANLSDYIWTNLVQVLDDPGSITEIDNLTISDSVPYGYRVVEIIPVFRTILNESERQLISDRVDPQTVVQRFGLSYNYELDAWSIVDETSIPSLPVVAENTLEPLSSLNQWLFAVYYSPNTDANSPTFITIGRGIKYIFESDREVRFFYDPDQTMFDVNSGRSLRDVIEISKENRYSLRERWEYDGDTQVWSNGDIVYPASYIPLASRSIAPADIEIFTSVGYTLTNGVISFTNPTSHATGDAVEIVYSNQSTIGTDVEWHIKNIVVEPDGYVDQRRVEISLVDSNENLSPEFPRSFNTIVNQQVDRIYFEKYVDFDDQEYTRIWKGKFVEMNPSVPYLADPVSTSVPTLSQDAAVELASVDLLKFSSSDDIDQFINELNGFPYTDANIGLVLYQDAPDGKELNGVFYTVQEDPNSLQTYTLKETNMYEIKIGRSFVDSRNGEQGSFRYKWKHYAPAVNRIDPSISNIQDMLILTRTYYNDVLLWKKENKPFALMPPAPTTQELRIQFSELDKYKMMSDHIVYKSGKFKVLFGLQAQEQLQARFKVVKLPNPVFSDNEIKSGVINAIDEFFAIENWDFGESFYYTELAAYIHKRLENSVATVVVVPTDAESQFGNLFQIQSEPNELFISTAKVDQVDIVKSLTETNLRVYK